VKFSGGVWSSLFAFTQCWRLYID